MISSCQYVCTKLHTLLSLSFSFSLSTPFSPSSPPGASLAALALASHFFYFYFCVMKNTTPANPRMASTATMIMVEL